MQIEEEDEEVDDGDEEEEDEEEDDEDEEEDDEGEVEEEDAHLPPRAAVGTPQHPGPPGAGGTPDPSQRGARFPLPTLPPSGLASRARGGWATTPGNMETQYLVDC